jgi:hypothetical protein
MLTTLRIPAPQAGVHIGQAPDQRRALRRLIRDLVAVTGVAVTELSTRKRPQRKRRLLFRRADSLTDADLDALVGEIGIDRWWVAAERATQPRLPLVAAE